MVYTIRVQKNAELQQPANPDLFTKNFDDVEDWAAVMNLCNSVKRVTWLESLVIPVRTDTVQNFCKDFFLPGFFNVALKTHDFSVKILFCILMPIYDLISLPIRVITALPRYIYNTNHGKESHPFYQYLIQNGVAAEDLNDGYAYLESDRIDRERNRVIEGSTINFMQLPLNVSNIRHELRMMEAPLEPQIELAE